MRILVTGSRNLKDYTLVRDVLQDYDPTFIIEGGATGADYLAYLFRSANEIKGCTYPADWETHGKAAGGIRNQQMLDEGKPDLVLAFPLEYSIGTWDMVRRAEEVGIKVKVIR